MRRKLPPQGETTIFHFSDTNFRIFVYIDRNEYEKYSSTFTERINRYEISESHILHIFLSACGNVGTISV